MIIVKKGKIMNNIEIVGYIASILVAISLTMSKILRLRIINTLGAITFSLYGFFVSAYPVLFVNAFIAIINIYYLFKMFRSKNRFDVLNSDKDSEYLKSFYDHYKKDIKNYFKNFKEEEFEDNRVIFILRNLRPVNLVVYKEQENGIIEIVLDYTIPEYRDFLNVKYLISIFKEQKSKKSSVQLVTKASTKAHKNYLLKVGFIKNQAGLFVKKI